MADDPTKSFSLIKRLKAGKRPVKYLDYPGVEGGRIGIRLPTEADHEAAKLAAWQFLVLDMKVDPDKVRGSAHYGREVYNQLLARILFDPESGDLQVPICDNAQDLKANMTAEERSILIQEMADFMSEADPDLDTPEGQAAATALCQEVEKKGVTRAALTALLRDTPPAILRRCVITLGSRLRACREAKSSSTPSSSTESSP